MSDVKLCRSCGAEIRWLRTKKGRAMPVDVSTAGPGDEVYDAKKHRSHFETCPQSAQWSGRREKGDD